MELQGLKKVKALSKLSYIALRRSKVMRDNTVVLDEYESGWKQYFQILERCRNLEDWLYIKGHEDVPHLCNINGKMHYGIYNVPLINRSALTDAIDQQWGKIQSITEYGCGIGRNLLYIKSKYPHIKCYGYELCENGVAVAKQASDKFGLSIEYAQLNYINDAPEKYVFPKTDCAFTMYSLEQLPKNVGVALSNIQERVNLGSIHIEPVIENYPKTPRGLIARIDNWKIGYLSSFEKNARRLKNVTIEKRILNASHNPLMFPSLYVLKKHTENLK